MGCGLDHDRHWLYCDTGPHCAQAAWQALSRCCRRYSNFSSARERFEQSSGGTTSRRSIPELHRSTCTSDSIIGAHTPWPALEPPHSCPVLLRRYPWIDYDTKQALPPATSEGGLCAPRSCDACRFKCGVDSVPYVHLPSPPAYHTEYVGRHVTKSPLVNRGSCPYDID
jgi:hypothetical protein